MKLYFKFHTQLKVTAKLLDMAPDAVDDLYDGCRQQAMETFIDSGLLRQELNSSDDFQRAWSGCDKLIKGGRKEHTAALLAYANGKKEFTQTFDNAVETMGGNVSTYENQFHFKAFHFLLMDSMSLQNPKTCKTVYLLEEECKANIGSKVRFGKFTKVHSNYGVLKSLDDWEGVAIFNITTCFFVNLGDDICGEDKEMALLSPAEVFTVEAFNKTIDDNEESTYTEIVLKHSAEQKSSHNCYIFSR